jgi:hypothetical protein
MRKIVSLVFVASTVFGQDLALAGLKQELKIAQDQDISDQKTATEIVRKTGAWPENMEGRGAARIARVQAALLNWIESQLPMGRSAIAIKSSDWEAAMHRRLVGAGIAEEEPQATSDPPEEPHDPFEDPGFGYVSVALTYKPELPDMLFVSGIVGVRCGGDQAVYGYRFDANGFARAISDHPTSDHGYRGAAIEVSDADFQDRRLLLIHRWSAQCASTWMGMTYSVFRMAGDAATPPVSLLSGQHGFWMGNGDDGLIFTLKPNELIFELLDSSIDTGIHNRTQVHRYSFADGVKRLEPVALQPQDFAEEWLTRPWSEVRSRSAPETERWHAKFQGPDFGIGAYTSVVPCAAKPDRWSIGFEAAEDKSKEPPEVHLLVRDLGNYRFEMEAVSDSEFEGCPGEGSPSDKHPWLSVEQLKALP